MTKKNVTHINQHSALQNVFHLRDKIRLLDEMSPKQLNRSGRIGKMIRELLDAVDQVKELSDSNSFWERNQSV